MRNMESRTKIPDNVMREKEKKLSLKTSPLKRNSMFGKLISL